MSAPREFTLSEARAHINKNEEEHLTHEMYLKWACDQMEKKCEQLEALQMAVDESHPNNFKTYCEMQDKLALAVDALEFYAKGSQVIGFDRGERASECLVKIKGGE